MRYATGDLFSGEFLRDDGAIGISMSVGWARGPRAVMGAGAGSRAAQLWPPVTSLLGEYYRQHKERSEVIGFRVFNPDTTLFFVPVKPFRSPANRSWQGPATLPRIEKSCQELACLVAQYEAMGAAPAQIALPRLGCGNGGLRWEDVRPILERHLTSPRFILVSTPFEAAQDERREAEELTISELFS